jgi:delta 1-pyrroline-5-carboxylate dehydrogenase
LQESIAEETIEALKLRLQTLRLGDPLDKNTDIGAINSREQLDKIEELIKAGDAEGAERWTAPCELPQQGWWCAPTVFTNVTQAHRHLTAPVRANIHKSIPATTARFCPLTAKRCNVPVARNDSLNSSPTPSR